MYQSPLDPLALGVPMRSRMEQIPLKENCFSTILQIRFDNKDINMSMTCCMWDSQSETS